MHARVYTKCRSHQEGPKGHSGLIYICAPASHNNPRQAVPQACWHECPAEYWDCEASGGTGSKRKASSSGVPEGGLEPPRPMTGIAQPFNFVLNPYSTVGWAVDIGRFLAHPLRALRPLATLLESDWLAPLREGASDSVSGF